MIVPFKEPCRLVLWYNKYIINKNYLWIKKIEVYTSPTCHYCVDLKKFLDEKGVEYIEYDVTADEEKRKELVERSQQVGVPIMFINDSEMIDGFDKEKITASLGLSG